VRIKTLPQASKWTWGQKLAMETITLGLPLSHKNLLIRLLLGLGAVVSQSLPPAWWALGAGESGHSRGGSELGNARVDEVPGWPGSRAQLFISTPAAQGERCRDLKSGLMTSELVSSALYQPFSWVCVSFSYKRDTIDLIWLEPLKLFFVQP
jgi:hypothetical protein